MLRAIVVPVVLGLLTLVGCSSGATEDPPPPTVDTATSGAATPTPKGRKPAEYATYVALGDSYTAAPLVPETDLTNGCLRSSNNYPSLVARGLPGTELVDVSCSGADTTALVGAQRTGDQAQPPQFDALTEDTDLVTVSIGGNDFGIFATLVGYCAQLRADDPRGNPCEKALGLAGEQDRLTGQLAKVRERLASVATGIRDRAPGARVLVVGYPQILPEEGTCPELLPLADGDVEFARRVVEGLGAALEGGARSADVEYVDLLPVTTGHDICSEDPWINGRVTDSQAALAFHPFAAEQEAVAALILERLGTDRP